MGTFEDDFRDTMHSEAPANLSPQLRRFWLRPVSDLAKVYEPAPGPAEQERHRIFVLMLMALVHEYWNGNKRGRQGTYPWNEDVGHGAHMDRDYFGHNIAAIAVNSDGVVLDFEFNHNKLYNSSAEHAEARLVKRVFSLAQVSDSWRPHLDQHAHNHVALSDYNMLSDVTIYTSLESCAQCAGTMALARVAQVVYLQTDPGMYFIGRILRNLTDDALRAPLPIAASDVGLPYLHDLDSAAADFATRVPSEPFWIDGAKRDDSPSVTSFLCTKNARDIFGRGRAEFAALVADPQAILQYPNYPRENGGGGKTSGSMKSNVEAVIEASDFLRYATVSGRRGTPHR